MYKRQTQSGFDDFGDPIVSGNDANWLEGDAVFLLEANTLDVVTDFLGVDTRTGNGGNGDFDGEVGEPTRMNIILEGIPAGEYSWTSFHHDTENIHTEFLFDISVDGGNTFVPAGEGQYKMTNSTPGSNPPEPAVFQGINEDDEVAPLTDLPSTAVFNFNATGDDVILQFTPLSADAVHTQIFGINAFQMEQLSVTGGGDICVVPDGVIAGDLDSDGTVAFADFLVLSQNFGSADVPYASGDVDCDGTVAFADFLVLSQNFGQSSAAQAVPEPAGFAIAAMGALFLGLMRRRRG